MPSRAEMPTGAERTGRGHAIYDFATGARLWPVAQVAAMLRVSRMTIYRMVHSGELEHVRIGRAFRIPDAGVRRILERPDTTARPHGQLCELVPRSH